MCFFIDQPGVRLRIIFRSTQGAKVAGDWTDSRLEIDPTPSRVRELDPLCAFSFIPLHIPARPHASYSSPCAP